MDRREFNTRGLLAGLASLFGIAGSEVAAAPIEEAKATPLADLSKHFSFSGTKTQRFRSDRPNLAATGHSTSVFRGLPLSAIVSPLNSFMSARRTDVPSGRLIEWETNQSHKGWRVGGILEITPSGRHPLLVSAWRLELCEYEREGAYKSSGHLTIRGFAPDNDDWKRHLSFEIKERNPIWFETFVRSHPSLLMVPRRIRATYTAPGVGEAEILSLSKIRGLPGLLPPRLCSLLETYRGMGNLRTWEIKIDLQRFGWCAGYNALGATNVCRWSAENWLKLHEGDLRMARTATHQICFPLHFVGHSLDLMPYCAVEAHQNTFQLLDEVHAEYKPPRVQQT